MTLGSMKGTTIVMRKSTEGFGGPLSVDWGASLLDGLQDAVPRGDERRRHCLWARAPPPMDQTRTKHFETDRAHVDLRNL
jgi:hypothetical protein